MSLGALRGCLDQVDRQSIAGWAQDDADPERRVSLVLSVNGAIVGRFLANQHRMDLEKSALGSGRHGFWVRIPGGLHPNKPYLIAVAREVDDTPLPGSPILLEPVTEIDAGLETGLAKAVGAVSDERGENRLLDLLARQTHAVLQRRADREIRGEAGQALGEFHQRWGERLCAIDGGVPGPAPTRRRALFIDDRVADPARDAGSVAALSHMLALAGLGYDVSLAAAAEMEAAAEVAARVEARGIRVWRAPYYTSVEDVLRRQQAGFEVVYLHRLSNASKYLTLVRHYMPKARVIYSIADLHHLRLQRQAEVEDRPDLQSYGLRVKLNEMLLAASADAVITHSAEEASLLKADVLSAQVHVVPWVLEARPGRAPFAQRRGVVFLGNYEHQPNVDAAHWLADSVMPLVWRTHPDIPCSLAGSAMPAATRKLEAAGLQMLGHVENLDALLGQARLTTAPLRFGAGVKGKVLESFARGVPCAMTPIAAEGLALPVTLQGCVGRDAEALAHVIITLHEDEAAHGAARDAALALIQARHSEAFVSTALKAAIDG